MLSKRVTFAFAVLFLVASGVFGWTSLGLWRVGLTPTTWPNVLLHLTFWLPSLAAVSAIVSARRGRDPFVGLSVNSAIWIAISVIASLNPPADWEASLDPRFLLGMGVLGLACASFLLGRRMNWIV